MFFKVSKTNKQQPTSQDEMMKTDDIPQEMTPFNTNALHRDIPEKAFDFTRGRRKPKKDLFVSIN